MRRKEREVKDKSIINEILKKGKYCRLALADNNRPYIVSLNYGFEEVSGNYIFYFHGASEGRKIDIIKRNPYGCLEIDIEVALVSGEEACSFSTTYKSIIAEGEITFLSESKEKKRALSLIMEEVTGKSNWNFPPLMLNKVTLFSLKAASLTCKVNG